MRTVMTVVLLLALAMSWLWFWTARAQSQAAMGPAGVPMVEDTVTCWVGELMGSPDETHYYALADLWNTIEPNVHVKMSVMSHGGYDSKLRVAIASGQPPDICFSGLETLESLQFSGKATDLAVTIPPKYFPQSQLDAMTKSARRSVTRNGKPIIFPIWEYAYGGFLLANNTWLKEAGFDDEQIRKNGWTFEQFRAAAKHMTRDTDGDGKTDTWGFGAALVHLPHLFLHEFGPGVWGKAVRENELLGYDSKSKKWVIHPDLSAEKIERVLELFDQLMNVDKSWNPGYLGMNFAEIIDDLTMRGKLGMTFGETPWTPRLRIDMWETNHALGVNQPPLADLTDIWMPTLRAGDRPVPRLGSMGFSVFRQTPYRGDAHTANAMRFAYFLTNPVHLARSQVRQFRHLPPSRTFGEIFPELLHPDDKWVNFYNDVVNSDVGIVPPSIGIDDPQASQYGALRIRVDEWLNRQGADYIQQVMYRKLTPHDAAVKFYADLKSLEQ